MRLDFNSDKLLFHQISEVIEDEILSGNFLSGERLPSIRELSDNYAVNPNTVLKEINLLVDAGILIKKRGLGMFISENSLDILRDKRYRQFCETHIIALVDEAKRLALSKEDITAMIEKIYEKNKG